MLGLLHALSFLLRAASAHSVSLCFSLCQRGFIWNVLKGSALDYALVQNQTAFS